MESAPDLEAMENDRVSCTARAPDSTDTMTLDQIERWIADHIKPKR
jgi:hypothetical protein